MNGILGRSLFQVTIAALLVLSKSVSWQPCAPVTSSRPVNIAHVRFSTGGVKDIGTTPFSCEPEEAVATCQCVSRAQCEQAGWR